MEENEKTPEQKAELEKVEAKLKLDADAKALGAVVCIDITHEGKDYLAYLKAPDRYAVGAFLSAEKTSVTEACEYIYDSAVMKDISPDYLTIRDNDLLFISACPAIQRSVPFKKNNSRIL